MRYLRSGLCAWAAGLLAACAHHTPPASVVPARAEARAYQYGEHELAVTTLVLGVEQPLGDSFALLGRLWADRVDAGAAVAGPVATPSMEGEVADASAHAEHPHVDSVSSASKAVAGGAAAREWRVEGLVGAELRGELDEKPYQGRVIARLSDEPDYRSVSVTALGTIELAERNFALSSYLGFARDEVDPLEPPREQLSSWPASHRRGYAGLSASQVLSTRLIGSAGIEFAVQSGTLSNPYRRVAVKSPRASDGSMPTYFPERMPDSRVRYAGYVGLACFVGWGSALHLRANGYADSWGVTSLIPQLSLVTELGRAWLVTLTYRYLGQSAATFHQAVFPDSDLAAERTSDPRLGPLQEHNLSAQLRYTFAGDPGEAFSMDITMDYVLSALHYRDIERDVNLSHVLSTGLGARY
jgi:hypothetical protein